MSKSIAALVGLLVMAIVTSWQLFLFLGFRDPQGVVSREGSYRLWLAIIAAVMACIAAALMYLFSRHERNEWPRAAKVPLGPAIAATLDDATATSSAPAPFDAIRWALRNPWLSEGQPNDRRPMPGADGRSSGSLSARRSSARRTHHTTYKKWSQARHD